MTKVSTAYPIQWHVAQAALMVEQIPADVSASDAFYLEEYVTLVQPEELDLLWPMRLKIERDEGAFLVSDDLTEVYGEGETPREAMDAYREALSGLRRVLTAREGELTPELKNRLAVLQSIVHRAT